MKKTGEMTTEKNYGKDWKEILMELAESEHFNQLLQDPKTEEERGYGFVDDIDCLAVFCNLEHNTLRNTYPNSLKGRPESYENVARFLGMIIHVGRAWREKGSNGLYYGLEKPEVEGVELVPAYPLLRAIQERSLSGRGFNSPKTRMPFFNYDVFRRTTNIGLVERRCWAVIEYARQRFGVRVSFEDALEAVGVSLQPNKATIFAVASHYWRRACTVRYYYDWGSVLGFEAPKTYAQAREFLTELKLINRNHTWYENAKVYAIAKFLGGEDLKSVREWAEKVRKIIDAGVHYRLLINRLRKDFRWGKEGAKERYATIINHAVATLELYPDLAYLTPLGLVVKGGEVEEMNKISDHKNSGEFHRYIKENWEFLPTTTDDGVTNHYAMNGEMHGMEWWLGKQRIDGDAFLMTIRNNRTGETFHVEPVQIPSVKGAVRQSIKISIVNWRDQRAAALKNQHKSRLMHTNVLRDLGLMCMFQDARAAGNCKPGIRAFMERHDIQKPYIAAWRLLEYHDQRERIENTILAAAEAAGVDFDSIPEPEEESMCA